MKKTILLILFATFLINCGGGGENESNNIGANPDISCTFKASDFTNGDSLQTADFYWSCKTPYQLYSMFFFDDGTGYSDSGIGAFTWSETGCQELLAHTAYGDQQITNMTGSISSGILVFHQIDVDSNKSADSSCVLVKGTSASKTLDSDKFDADINELEYSAEQTE